jgi:hypothetical protein
MPDTHLEQAFSHSPMSFHHVTSLFALVASLLLAPMPWFVFRKGRERMRSTIQGAGWEENTISSIEKTMGGMLIVTYVAFLFCVIALTRLT